MDPHAAMTVRSLACRIAILDARLADGGPTEPFRHFGRETRGSELLRSQNQVQIQ